LKENVVGREGFEPSKA